MADLQHPGLAHLLQRPGRQADRLLDFQLFHLAQQFKAHLGDFLERVALRRGAVDVLVVIIFQRFARGGLCRLGNGKGHVRLEGQQAAIQVGKRDDLLRGEETAVLLIQAILLKPAHVVFAAARRFVQRAERKGGTLLGLQPCKIKLHAVSPFLSQCFSTPFARHVPCRLFLQPMQDVLVSFYFILVKL